MLELLPGDPHHLGAKVVSEGVLFGVWSPEAEQVWLCLCDEAGAEQQRLALHPGLRGIWHGLLPGAEAGLVYGFRAAGRWAPEQGLRFNPQRLLLDPYAREVVGRYSGDLSLYLDHEPEAPSFAHGTDNAAVALKARVVADVPPRPSRARPTNRVIAEVHVRTASALHPGIPAELRGTYAGLAHPALIAHWHRLGVTTLELMPLQFRADEARLQAMGMRNHWGYTPIGWMAPEPRYASDPSGRGAADELRLAVADLRRAGFEVLLDMVFNHSAETDAAGPALSLKGLAHRHYYRVQAEPPSRLVDWTGCGNTLDLSQPMVLRLVIDSLRHWVQAYGFDGFRFDLAPALGRDDAGRFSAGSAFFAAIEADPVLRQVLCIAEPWDLGPHSYQLGGFPSGWLEWNDQARDGLRAYWLQPDESRGNRAEMARRLAGSSDAFASDPMRPRRPSASVNFITAHDGFTLRDLVSYNQRHNLANGERNQDGHAHNLSWNSGAEGPSEDLTVLRNRAALQRALLASLMLARGTPMLLMGDELGHSQQGNNNAYCQDNPITWLNWSAADPTLSQYVARLTALRRADPALHADTWWDGRPTACGLPDVHWTDAEGQPLTPAAWHHPSERALRVHLAPPGCEHETLLLFNPDSQAQWFELPPLQRGPSWHALLDSQQMDGSPAPQASQKPPGSLMVPARCVQVWCSQALSLFPDEFEETHPGD
ncbi:glycogen debranching protein GlgX [Ideonella sp.]|uniref:glycogen debranching protein GlgX n=1 Tax=Ideonella sp. TaxID=1929293 RepID=UPI003BB69FA1